MSLQFSAAVRNARLNAIETLIGVNPVMRLMRNAVIGANCAAADFSPIVAELVLPPDWMAAAASGQKTLAGSWQAACTIVDTIGHFRVYDSTGVVCHMQGNVTITGGGGVLTLDAVACVPGQLVTVTGFTWTEGGA